MIQAKIEMIQIILKLITIKSEMSWDIFALIKIKLEMIQDKREMIAGD